MTPLLVVDIGNTTTKIGIWTGGTVAAVTIIPTEDPSSLPRAVAQAAAAAGTELEQGRDLALCSVVPRACDFWLDWSARRGRAPFVLHGDTPTPLTNRYRDPARLGPDRLAAAVAAVHRVGAPALAATCGTALVLDAVSPSREYLGGAIWVGVGTGLAALAKQTAALPVVDASPPGVFIGGDTTASLQAGAIYGTASLIEGMAAQMKTYLGEEARLVLGGGDAELLSPHLHIEHELAPYLVLEGLGLIWEYNQRD